jgi:hypothetical protein
MAVFFSRASVAAFALFFFDCRRILKHFRFMEVPAAVSALAGGSVVIRPSRADMDAE